MSQRCSGVPMFLNGGVIEFVTGTVYLIVHRVVSLFSRVSITVSSESLNCQPLKMNYDGV